MDSEITAAIIGSGAGLVGALAGFTGALVAAGRAAKSAYAGPLDQARRIAQREACARLLDAANEYARKTAPLVRPASLFDMDARDLAEGDDGPPDVPHLLHRDDPQTPDELRERLRQVSPDAIRGAARHVALDCPRLLSAAAAGVHEKAVALHEVLEDAGPVPNEWDGLPRPDRAPRAEAELAQVIDRFVSLANAHLNDRPLEPA